jgi:hypothetical protein
LVNVPKCLFKSPYESVFPCHFSIGSGKRWLIPRAQCGVVYLEIQGLSVQQEAY